MKSYIFTDFGKTWWAQFRCDGMLNSDNQTVLQIRSQNVAGVISNTDLDDAMTALGLPNHVGYRFTEAEFKALAMALNLNLTKQYQDTADVATYAALLVQATPTFSPVAGPIAFGATVTITSASSDAIYYTLDGTVPTTASPRQSVTACVIDANTKILIAMAVKAGKYQSVVGVASYTQAVAAVPTNVVLAVGGATPVAGVTNVAIPADGATDTTGAVTGWAADTANKIKITVTGAEGTTNAITINGGAYVSAADYAITAAEDLTIVITTTKTGCVTTVRTFTITVAPAA